MLKKRRRKRKREEKQTKKQKQSRKNYKEKRRRKDIEVTRRIKGGMKRRETDPASNQFPKCSPPLEHTEIHRVA